MKNESPKAYAGIRDQNRGAYVNKYARNPHDQWNAKKTDGDGARRDGHPFDSEIKSISRVISQTENEIANKASHR